ncbi:hypothetical protein O181_009184 [Austropuccinia psidii MF-1]|uniref:Uncharacterized protein n=1 Tax=Austropuccinia psidii MF-1 TaxID=1389203 RepID=A0A9Q3BNV6_9BASI|nr:hypothetical protein [Austropuccinia psidii MF-1]
MPENRFFWTFTFKLFLKLVSCSKYEGINLNITNEQVIWNALQNHFQHQLMSKYHQHQWSADHKEKHKKMCLRLAHLTKLDFTSFLINHLSWTQIPIVEECCSDYETANKYEEEHPNQPYSKASQQKQCNILKLPWQNSGLDRIMQIIDKLHQPVDDQNPNAPKNSCSRIYNEHQHPIVEPPLIETSSPDRDAASGSNGPTSNITLPFSTHSGQPFVDLDFNTTDDSNDGTFRTMISNYGWDFPWAAPSRGKIILDSQLLLYVKKMPS